MSIYDVSNANLLRTYYLSKAYLIPTLDLSTTNLFRRAIYPLPIYDLSAAYLRPVRYYLSASYPLLTEYLSTTSVQPIYHLSAASPLPIY